MKLIGSLTSPYVRKVRIAHRNGSTARVSKLDLALYFETGDETLLPKVLPGDSIYLPEKNRPWLDEPKEDTIRVLGAVARPGRYAQRTPRGRAGQPRRVGGLGYRSHAGRPRRVRSTPGMGLSRTPLPPLGRAASAG